MNLVPAKIKIGKMFEKYINVDSVDTYEKYDGFEIKMEKSRTAYSIVFYIHYSDENCTTYKCIYPNNKKPYDMEKLECLLQD